MSRFLFHKDWNNIIKLHNDRNFDIFLLDENVFENPLILAPCIKQNTCVFLISCDYVLSLLPVVKQVCFSRMRFKFKKKLSFILQNWDKNLHNEIESWNKTSSCVMLVSKTEFKELYLNNDEAILVLLELEIFRWLQK